MIWFKKKRLSLGTVISNMEESAEQFLRPKRFNWKMFLTVSLLAVLVLFLIFFIPALISGGLIASHAFKIAKNGQNLAAVAGENDWRQAKDDLGKIKNDLQGIGYDLNFAVPISLVPPFNKPVKTMRQMIDATVDLISSYDEALTVVIAANQGLSQEDLAAGLSSANYRKNILKAIGDNQDKIFRIQQDINDSKTKLENIPTNDLSGIFQSQIVFLNDILTQAVANTDTALPIMANLPRIMGYQKERNYLLLFQNNMEMRPTGGFIGSYGLVKIKDGEIKSVFTDDVYNLDRLSEGKMKVLAPEPMLKYNNQKYWYLRDANWSPDWPASAKQILWFFNAERKNAGLPVQKLDGIIAITPEFIANLIGVVGDLEARGVVFNEKNFAMELEQFVEFDYVSHGLKETERKSIIGTLTGMIIQKAYDLPAKDKLKLWLAFKENIDQKNILVYLVDLESQEYFDQKNWSGQVKRFEGDYIMVVDSNLAALKTDSIMKKSLAYRLRVDDKGDLIATLTLTYGHQSKVIPGLISRYRDYVRVYVPEGTWFLRASLTDVNGTKNLEILKDLAIGNELGKRYGATFFTVEPGKATALSLEYRLPESIKKQYQDGVYKLLVQKQPGTIRHNFGIDLGFGKYISAYHADSLPSTNKGKNLGWQTDLSADREFQIKF
ncbi:MAG: DUF4012 domain-containing protein [Patescibacteria group bacterium]